MIDFTPLRRKERSFGALASDLTIADLRAATNQMIDAMLARLAEAEDADVTFVAHDPEAESGWTLGHVIAHTTATAEEAAFIAAELARGVAFHGRSRYEVPWEQITTVAQCRARLEESRRMRLASLAMWPDQPHLDVTQEMPWLGESLAAPARFALGLMHDEAHLGQIADVMRQAREAREDRRGNR
jgi:hypothetical protein